MPEVAVIFQEGFVDKSTGEETTGGYIYIPDDKRPGAIVINPNKASVGMSITHETGHSINHLGFGTVDPDTQKFLLGTDAYDTEFFRATHTEKVQDAFRTLVSQLDESATVQQLRVKATSKNTSLRDKKYIKYLLSEEELFARSYSQYIATKSVEKCIATESADEFRFLLTQVDVERALTLEDKIPELWQDEEFKPIGRAFDQLFEAKGWKK